MAPKFPFWFPVLVPCPLPLIPTPSDLAGAVRAPRSRNIHIHLAVLA